MQLNSNTELQGRKYRIIRVLGQGGFGITYLAENTFFEKKVAIKEFFPKDFCGRDNTSHLTLGTPNNAETVAKLKERFLKEAKNIAMLDRPGIVKIHDIFEENNTAYYVMDYIEGENLNEMVKRNGPLSEAKAIEYITKVGEALEYIHSRKMTHFDVKPANIVVRRSDDRPILIDFGLSKQFDIHGDATSTLMQGVSHGYSPIELYNAGAITSFSPQTDVYSLGATLFYLVTGKVPPSANQIIEDGLIFPESIQDSITEIIEKAMTISRSKRPTTILPDLKIIKLEGIDSTHTSSPSLHKEDTLYIDSNNSNDDDTDINTDIQPSKHILYILIACLIPLAIIVFVRQISESDQRNSTHIVNQANKDNSISSKPKTVDALIYDTVLGRCFYSGEVNENNVPHGKGFANFTEGDAHCYNGDWVNGNMDGDAKYTLRCGDTFIGKFKNNKYAEGKYTIDSSKEYFVGTFLNGQPHNGTWYDKTGNIIY